VLVDSVRLLGGIMAANAAIEAAGGGKRVEKWFGLGFVGSALQSVSASGSLRGLNALEVISLLGSAVGTAVDVVATTAMFKTSFDMLGGQPVDFGIQGVGVLTSASVGQAVSELKASAYTGNCGNPDSGAAYYVPATATSNQTIELCQEFFTFPVLPTNATLTVKGAASMAGAMIHEFAHLSFGANDDGYFCNPGIWALLRNGKFKLTVKGLAKSGRGLGLLAADSYRCWAEDAELGTSDRLTGVTYSP
jgi:hypothetical protein